MSSTPYIPLSQIGGLWNPSSRRVEAAFHGVLAGLVYNGERPLEMAMDDDPVAASSSRKWAKKLGTVRRLQSIPFDYR